MKRPRSKSLEMLIPILYLKGVSTEHWVQFAGANSRDQDVDDFWEPLLRRGDDPGLPLLELDLLPANSNEEYDPAFLIRPPPRANRQPFFG